MANLQQPPHPPTIHILRHGESLHNIERGYPHRDPPLTPSGQTATQKIHLDGIVPSHILISPMTRTIQTAINAFPSILSPSPSSTRPKVEIWPDLREAHDATCNKGLPRAILAAKYPHFDFSECLAEWEDYPPHTVQGATARAERVRRRLRGLGGIVLVISHRGFIAFLVGGERFGVCEVRGYRFGGEGEGEGEKEGKGEGRIGVHVDTGEEYDFGPTVLVPV